MSYIYILLLFPLMVGFILSLKKKKHDKKGSVAKLEKYS
ncbi:Uncharacterised protein [Staphylococcus aureus]|nr:Uncharacterised protein [Staphylococcus aureus]